MKRSVARLALFALCLLAGFETLLAVTVHRRRVDEEHWAALRSAAQRLPPGDGWLLATPYLGPRARMEVPQLAAAALEARPDLWGLSRVHVVGMGEGPWQPAWSHELPPGVRPLPAARSRFGALALQSFELPDAPRELASFRESRAVMVTIAGKPCRAAATRLPTWTCRPGGNVQERVVEIEHQARRCLALEVDDGTTTALLRRSMPTGNLLRGHIGFTDFNGVLRNDVPVRVELLVDGEVHLRAIATDEEGWKAFEVPVTPGHHDVELRVLTPRNGQWNANGYAPGVRRPACLELRSFAHGGAAS